MKAINTAWLLVLVSLVSCNKGDGSKDIIRQNALKGLPGIMYYEWADDGVYALTPKALSKTVFLPDDPARNSWYISRNNQFVLSCSDSPNQDYGAYQFTITNASGGDVISQFSYYPTNGSTNTATGSLSADGTLIAVNPTYDDGIVVLDDQGNEIQHIEQVNNEKITTDPVWMPDNTLLFCHHNLLLKTNEAFNDVTLVKTFDWPDPDGLTVSRNGAKIAVEAAGHIWLMNADGSGLTQVTTSSSSAEVAPEFSPDGQYLLVGTNYHTTTGGGPWGYYYDLKVIPADGNLYAVDDGAESDGVITVQLPNGYPESASGKVCWR